MSTDKMELVETHNIAKSLARLRSGAGGYDDGRWRRALYHALLLSGHERDTQKKIREALELP